MKNFTDNETFKNFTNQNFSELSNWINTLNPYEFALIGVVAAFLIAPTLNANQQNSIGNFLEEVGQILLTISAQSFTLNSINKSIDPNYLNLLKEINNIKEQINKKSF